MPLTIRERALEAFKAALENNGGAFAVKRNGGDTLATANAPAVDIVDGGQTRHVAGGGDGEIFGQDTYTMRARCFGYVRSADGDALGAAISALYGQLVKAALADPTLGGVADYVREAVESLDDPEMNHDGNRPHANVVVHFEIDYVTKSGDPTAAP